MCLFLILFLQQGDVCWRRMHFGNVAKCSCVSLWLCQAHNIHHHLMCFNAIVVAVKLIASHWQYKIVFQLSDSMSQDSMGLYLLWFFTFAVCQIALYCSMYFGECSWICNMFYGIGLFEFEFWEANHMQGFYVCWWVVELGQCMCIVFMLMDWY